jgi:AcrR family transcriptional regulator
MECTAYTSAMARGLSVERIVAAAVDLADEEGFSAVSMARVAKRCGFTTMALYRHVASKDELAWRMLDRAVGPAPKYEITDWRSGLERWARELLARLRAHPWAIDVPITGVLASFSQVTWLDRGLQALDGTGLQPGEDADVVLLLNGYVFWAVRLEVSLAAAPPEPLVPVEFDLESVPFVRRVFESGGFEDESTEEENFASGLNRVLDGIGVLIAQRSSPRPVPPNFSRTSSK